MDTRRVLVAFSSRTGSTAGTASVIAAELRAAGMAVDLRPAADVASVVVYDAIVLGSGMFVASHASDGGGFLTRFADAIAPRPVWLFCVGPIGREPARGVGTSVPVEGDCGAAAVARAIGARGIAAFGASGVGTEPEAVLSLLPEGLSEARAWARTIAAELRADTASPPPALRVHQSRRRHRGSRSGFAPAG